MYSKAESSSEIANQCVNGKSINYKNICKNSEESNFNSQIVTDDDADIDSVCASTINAVLAETSSLTCLQDSACNAEFKNSFNITMECIKEQPNKCKNANKTLFIGTCYCECKENSSTNQLYLKLMNAYNSDICTQYPGKCLSQINTTDNTSQSQNISTTTYSNSCQIGQYQNSATFECMNCQSSLDCKSCTNNSACSSCYIGNVLKSGSCKCENKDLVNYFGNCYNQNKLNELWGQRENLNVKEQAQLAYYIGKNENKEVVNNLLKQCQQNLSETKFQEILDAFLIIAQSNNTDESLEFIDSFIDSVIKNYNLTQTNFESVFNAIDSLIYKSQTSGKQLKLKNQFLDFIRLYTSQNLFFFNNLLVHQNLTVFQKFEMKNGILRIEKFSQGRKKVYFDKKIQFYQIGYEEEQVEINSNFFSYASTLVNNTEQLYMYYYLTQNQSIMAIQKQYFESKILFVGMIKKDKENTTSFLSVSLPQNQYIPLFFDKGTGTGICGFLDEEQLQWSQQGMYRQKGSNTTCLTTHLSIFAIVSTEVQAILALSLTCQGFIILLIFFLLNVLF